MDFKDYILEELKILKEKFLYRERKVLDKNIIDFSSNDYLGLKDCVKTKEKLKENLINLFLGSGSSTFVSGYFDIQKELEEYLAKFKNTEACFVIGSGYLANIGVIPALANENSSIFSDELNHASIIDGV
ncbi:MAG: 8-amino-7-oxononanoate synthase, partial [Persephonella sp.]